MQSTKKKVPGCNATAVQFLHQKSSGTGIQCLQGPHNKHNVIDNMYEHLFLYKTKQARFKES